MAWVVLGAGRSGIGAKKLLESQGETVYLFDEYKSKLPPEIQTITIDDMHHSIFFEEETCLVISPGFSLEHPVLLRAQKLKNTVLSEIDLALRYFKGQVIAVTGTNGKSTTVTMIAHIMKELKLDFQLGGNIGVSASSLMLNPEHKYLVLELSSYQIEASHLLKPHIALFIGFTPDHLQRHKTLKGYFEAKWKLFSQQNENDFSIFHEDVFKIAKSNFNLDTPKSQILTIKESDLEILKNLCEFRWKHDQFNAMFAVKAVSCLTGKSIQELAPLLKNFRGLPYRCEIIGKIGPWNIINDSKGTNIDSTSHALTNVNGKITLFLGGLTKGESFLEILNFKEKIDRVLTFGQGHKQIYTELHSHISVTVYETLHDLVKDMDSILIQSKGDLLFSPACASQDEFFDFEKRGQFFTECVHKSLKKLKDGIVYEPLIKTEAS